MPNRTAPPSPPEASAERLQLAELLSALSYALDITEGQPAGHCVRACWIGMRIGRRIGLPDDALWELYYALLLKDLGCSSNAARICELYLTDDLSFKRDFKFVNRSLPQVLGFVFAHTGVQSGLGARLRAVANIMRNGGDIAQELIETRCHRGADIARRLRFSEAVAQGIQHLDEHWDGRGRPTGAAGEAIPVYARIALLAQVIDVFQTAGGAAAARREAKARRGTWFDPALVDAFLGIAGEPDFWTGLADPDLRTRIYDLEPAQHRVAVDEDYLDDIAAAFGHVVDAKSPYTSGHSERVAGYADRLGEAMGVGTERRRWLRRAALLHDVGKLGVSNAVLDKPARLDEDEWAAVQAHATHTEAILSRISSFREMARVSAAHHERLDGAGYPHALSGGEITLETRIITVADFFDALTAERPYRGALPVTEALDIMRKTVGGALDPDVFAALETMVGAEPAAQAA
ncbi:HD-GYP domain-containing protein [Brevundimonas lenta]|uniref:HD-GYP domain-containing protein (C-di-GMP phosphodiesterase class II) n=1 Tax=Brevundimonas lenta TaxID=424796 RepID=A0A7W6JCA6_9CAUL|nr:HD-GYP domain-containing protein [Brevundimonas lenta]MBB4082506.1 HD-GYP domain-containing protein (c-di-GMP phosphodiesterase class II) [Brevundimonas lenta]